MTNAVTIPTQEEVDRETTGVQALFFGDGAENVADVKTWVVVVPLIGLVATVMGSDQKPHEGRIPFGPVLSGLVENICIWADDPKKLAKVRANRVVWQPTQDYVRPSSKTLRIPVAKYQKIIAAQQSK